MALHFSEDELRGRRDRTCAILRERSLAGLLVFRQESMYYLTGYDTFGYCFFQCLYLAADGRMTLLTRAPDLRQALHTSDIDDIRVWVDRAGLNPADDLVSILEEHGARGAALGIEYDAYGLTAHNWRRLEQALNGFCELRDASEVVSRLRAVKSATEMTYVRRAAELADDALDAALDTAAPGVFEGDVLAGMHNAIFKGGGDYPGNEFIIGSGPGALLVRYFSGRRHLDAEDQLTLEWAGAYRHYHAAMMRTVLVGSVSRPHRDMHAACVDALAASIEALRPGRPVGEVFDAHARVLDRAGYREHRMNACGYSLGTTFTPTWMDWPMFYAGNTVTAEPNMVFFLHMIIADSAHNRAMTLGHTVRVGERESASLSRHSLELLRR